MLKDESADHVILSVPLVALAVEMTSVLTTNAKIDGSATAVLRYARLIPTQLAIKTAELVVQHVIVMQVAWALGVTSVSVVTQMHSLFQPASVSHRVLRGCTVMTTMYVSLVTPDASLVLDQPSMNATRALNSVPIQALVRCVLTRVPMTHLLKVLVKVLATFCLQMRAAQRAHVKSVLHILAQSVTRSALAARDLMQTSV